MYGEKSWWKSKTIMSVAVSIVLKLLAMGGVAVDALDPEQLTMLLLAVGSVVADLIAIWGRFKATNTVGA